MSEKGKRGSERDAVGNPWSMERRRLLRLTGASAAGLGMLGAGTDAASAGADCADGPFERTYESGTINFARIQSEQRERGTPSDVSAAGPEAAGRGRDGSGAPPYGRGRGRRADEESAALEIGTEYEGLGSDDTRGGVPSDSQIATGRSKNVHAVNQQVAVYDKRSGTKQRQVQLEDVWQPVIAEPEGGFFYGYPFVFDPRARYDRNADRFVLAAVQYEPGVTADGEAITREDVEEGNEPGEGEEGGESKDPEIARPPKGYLLVAVSANGNPNGKWYVYRIPPEDGSGVDNEGLVDYPALGLDRDAVYLTQNFFGTDTFEVTMAILDKEELYAGETVTAHQFDNLNSPGNGFDFTVQPALQPFSGGSSGTYYLVNSVFSTGGDPVTDTLTLWEVTDPVSDPSLSCYPVEVGRYDPPPVAEQPGSEKVIDTLGTRLMNADYDGGSLWTAHSVAADWNGDGTPVAAVRWYEIDTASRELVQSGVYGEAGTSYFIPTVGADDGTTVIAHNVSGPDTFPRMDVAGRTAGFAPGTIEDSVVVEEGKSKYAALPRRLQRWGDYNGVSVDPRTGNFWTVSQYSPDVNVPVEADERDPYATRIAEVSFGGDGPDGGRGQ